MNIADDPACRLAAFALFPRFDQDIRLDEHVTFVALQALTVWAC